MTSAPSPYISPAQQDLLGTRFPHALWQTDLQYYTCCYMPSLTETHVAAEPVTTRGRLGDRRRIPGPRLRFLRVGRPRAPAPRFVSTDVTPVFPHVLKTLRDQGMPRRPSVLLHRGLASISIHTSLRPHSGDS